MFASSEGSSASPEAKPTPLSGKSFLRRATPVLQRIGWLRPSAAERRLWLVEGAVILAAVALVGAVMFLLLW